MNSHEEITTKLWNKFSNVEIKSMDVIPTGFKNRSMVVTDQLETKWVMKIYAHDFLGAEEIEERAQLVKKLEDDGINVLEMEPGLDGKFCQYISEEKPKTFATISRHIPIQFSEITISIETVKLLAQELRLLHMKMSKLTPSKEFRRLQLLDALQEFSTKESKQHITTYFKKEDPSRKDRESDVLGWFSKHTENLAESFSQIKNHDEYQLIHGDFNLGNFLVIDSSLEKIFDFDEMMLAPSLYEVGIAIYYLDYDRPMYLDRLIGTFLKSYFQIESISEKDITKVLFYMKYRAYYRFARYFTYYQYKDRPGEHFTKFQRIYEEIDALDPSELTAIVNSERL